MLPMALFVVVILGTLALTLSRFSAQTSLSISQEAISTQAFYAAESGTQYAMNQLFYVASGGATLTRGLVDGNCTALNGSSLTFTTAGLNNCDAQLSCSVSTDSGNTTSFYALLSEGNCGSGDVSAQRTIEASAVMR